MASPGLGEAAKKEVVVWLTDVSKLFRQPLPSSAEELFVLLDKTEHVLCKVWQRPEPNVVRLLAPISNQLITDELLHHSDANVQVAVAGCLSEMTRISAPKAPYEDPIMTEVFQLFMVVLKHLSVANAYNFAIAYGILANMAEIRTCLLMLEVVSEEEMAETFELFFNAIQPDHPRGVFNHMEAIMTMVMEEVEEEKGVIPFKLLRPLLASVKNDNKEVSPSSWELGITVIEKCATMLQPSLKEAVKAMNLDVEEYEEIVISLCRDISDETNMEKEVSKTDLEVPSPSIEDVNGNNMSDDDNSLETSKFARSDSEASDGAELGPEEGSGNPSHKESDSTKEVSLSKRGRSKQKEIMKNQHDDREWSSQVRKKILQAKMKENSSSAIQKKNKRMDAESSNSDKEKEEWILNDNVIGEKELSNQGVVIRKKETKGEVIPRKKDKMLGSTSTSTLLQTKSNKNLAQEQKPGKPAVEYGKELVNKRVKIWWPKDKAFYSGTVADFNPVTKRHMIKYDDEEVEKLNMKKQRWVIVDDKKPEESSGQGAGQSSAQEADRPSSSKDNMQERIAKRKGKFSKDQHGASSSKRPPKGESSGVFMRATDDSPPDTYDVMDDMDDASESDG